MKFRKDKHLFFSEREKFFFEEIADEAIQDVSAQHILYFAVDLAESEYDELYNEVIQRVFKQPIEMSVLIEYDPPKQNVDKIGPDTIQNIDVFCDKDLLREKSLEVLQGDFLQWGFNFYQVRDLGGVEIIHGMPAYNHSVKLSCTLTRDSFLPKYLVDYIADNHWE